MHEDQSDEISERDTMGGTDPDGNPYAHNAEQAEAHKRALAEGDGPVSNETARAYLKAYPADAGIERSAMDWQGKASNRPNGGDPAEPKAD